MVCTASLGQVRLLLLKRLIRAHKRSALQCKHTLWRLGCTLVPSFSAFSMSLFLLSLARLAFGPLLSAAAPLPLAIDLSVPTGLSQWGSAVMAITWSLCTAQKRLAATMEASAGGFSLPPGRGYV